MWKCCYTATRNLQNNIENLKTPSFQWRHWQKQQTGERQTVTVCCRIKEQIILPRYWKMWVLLHITENLTSEQTNKLMVPISNRIYMVWIPHQYWEHTTSILYSRSLVQNDNKDWNTHRGVGETAWTDNTVTMRYHRYLKNLRGIKSSSSWPVLH